MKLNIFIFLILISNIGFSQNWKNYKGQLQLSSEEKEIEMKILFLNEGILMSSYRELNSPTQFKLAGEIKNDSIYLAIRLNDEYKGYLAGKFKEEQKQLKGNIINENQAIIGTFKLIQTYKESYTDYLKEHRSLYEHKTFDEALVNPTTVKSIDVEGQDLERIPDVFEQFNNLVSINLLGNKLDSFPVELTKTKKLNELSLCSNDLKVVGKEIGELKELRILIMNFNQIETLPKEMGNLTELLYLDLGGNKISSFPDEIGNLKKLQELHVERNLLSKEEEERLQHLLPNCVIHFKY